MKTLKSSKSSRHWQTQYYPQWLVTAKQPETIQNSAYILIYEEGTATFWKSDENSQMKTMRFSRSSNPLRNQRKRICSAQQQQACDKMLPPRGQVLGLTRPKTKGLRWPSQMASWFIAPDQQRFNVPGSTWSHPLNTNSSCHATTSCLHRSQKGVYMQELFSHSSEHSE